MKKDFFVSYNKADKEWAKWIAGTLEESGYSVFLQAWDILPGDDFIERMNDFLANSKSYIAVYSKSFHDSNYCMKEFQTAFNEHINKNIDMFLPIRVDDIETNALYKTIVYIDLFDIEESKAKERLLNGIGFTKNPRRKGQFPGCSILDTHKINEVKKSNIAYPGLLKSSMQNSNSLSSESMRVKNIVIIESEKVKNGEVFSRLVHDVFHALGFGEPRCEVSQPGREIDIVLQHRTESRFALIKSKATIKRANSADINKFVGAFDVERGKYDFDGNSVVGYYVARSGFEVTAIEQEDERFAARKGRSEKNEQVCLGPKEIIRELIQGKVICTYEKAIDAIKYTSVPTLSLCEYADVIACEHGLIWVIYYSSTHKQSATHFAFVHADGNQLHNSIANMLLNQKNAKVVPFSGLSYIAALPDAKAGEQAAKDAYFKYLENELGEIQFEGMPTDKEAGAVKINLESIFVPLRFAYERLEKNVKKSRIAYTTISGIFSRTPKAAILAKPGGGKSTLIKRIALAYAYPDRRDKVDDGLPDRDWFPVYIRCRDLGEDATKCILEIIKTIIQRAEITEHKRSFESLVEDALQDGRVLFLIDGLDEISNEKNRICFVNQLRTFVATYPTIHMIITSREAGFRAVAGTLASYCERYSVANFQEKEIRYLCLKWHQAILGESMQTEIESNKVCDIILNDPRIIALAENPLLLTTLLFVKRWVGYLPTKKCRLYEEMIKLLLVTWNAVAHDRLDMDETEPQLAFVAYYMTTHGQQKITRDRLNKCIIEARKALPELLSYTTVSPSRLIDQVEERSSLLIQSGLEESDNGQWVPSYEFSHLSFQEYLTAKAIAEGWIPDSYDRSILEVLKSHINEDHWKEVIPLVAVLLGRHAKPLIEYLIEIGISDEPLGNSTFTAEYIDPEDAAPLHLANCIAGEVPMSQELLEKAIVLVVKRKQTIEMVKINHASQSLINVFDTILRSKYGDNYRDTVKATLFHGYQDKYIYEFLDAWIDIYIATNDVAPGIDSVSRLMKSRVYEDQVTGALFMMQLAFNNSHFRSEASSRNEKVSKDMLIMTDIFSVIIQLLQTDDHLSIYSAAWCIAWSGYNKADIIPYEFSACIVKRLTDLWLRMDFENNLKRTISWGLFSVCMPNLQKNIFYDFSGLKEAIEEKYLNPKNDFDRYTAIHLAVLTDHWTKEETKNRLKLNDEKYSHQNAEKFSRFMKESGFHNNEQNTVAE